MRRNSRSRFVRPGLGAAATLVLFSSCATGPRLHENVRNDVALLPANEILEMAVDEDGMIVEIEYHTTADRLPAAVRSAAEKEMPGGTVVSCEKEYTASGEVRWEMEKSVGGLKKEILFSEDGRVIATEFQIPASSAPRAVLDAADLAVPGGDVTSVEEVKEGGRLEYHVKKTKNGFRYKIVLAPDGALVRALREVPAEVEVPLP